MVISAPFVYLAVFHYGLYLCGYIIGTDIGTIHIHFGANSINSCLLPYKCLNLDQFLSSSRLGRPHPRISDCEY